MNTSIEKEVNYTILDLTLDKRGEVVCWNYGELEKRIVPHKELEKRMLNSDSAFTIKMRRIGKTCYRYIAEDEDKIQKFLEYYRKEEVIKAAENLVDYFESNNKNITNELKEKINEFKNALQQV